MGYQIAQRCAWTAAPAALRQSLMPGQGNPNALVLRLSLSLSQGCWTLAGLGCEKSSPGTPHHRVPHCPGAAEGAEEGTDGRRIHPQQAQHPLCWCSPGGSGKETTKCSVIQISNQQEKPNILYKLTAATNVLRNSSAPSFPPANKKVPFVLACGFFISHQALPLNHQRIS